MNVMHGRVRQGVVFWSNTGWHWIVTSGRRAGKAGVVADMRAAKSILRNVWCRAAANT